MLFVQLVPFICPSCNLNFCVKHRIDIDHKCEAGKTGNANQVLVENPKVELKKETKIGFEINIELRVTMKFTTETTLESCSCCDAKKPGTAELRSAGQEYGRN